MLQRHTSALWRARPAYAPSSQCNRRSEQSPPVSGGSRGIFPGIRLGKSCRLSGSWPIRPAPLRFSLLIHLDVESAQMTLSRGELWVHRRRANNRSVPVSLSESRKLVSRDLPRLIGSAGSSPGIALLSGPGVLVL